MRILCVALLLIFGCLESYAAEPADILSKFSGEEKRWVLQSLTAKEVSNMLSECAMRIEKRDLSTSWFRIYAGRVNRFKKYEFFESDTGISKKWLDSCNAFLAALKNARSKVTVMEANKQTKTKEYKQWDKYYKDTASQFAALVKNPIPANQVTVNTLAQKKKALLDAYRQQQKAKAKAGKKAAKAKNKK